MVAYELSRVAAVVVSFRARPYLEACLRSLDGLAGLAERLVVDNASGDGTAESAGKFPGVRVIANAANLGFAAAATQGARATLAPYVLLLNADVEVNQEAISTLVRFMDAQPRCGAASARLLAGDGREQLPFRLDRPLRIRWAPGACLLLRRAACDPLGWFDPAFFFYNEDVDLGIRLRRAGWRIWYVPAATVIHHQGKSTDPVRARTVVHGYRGGMRLVAKHYPWAAGMARLAIRAEIRIRAARYRRLADPDVKQRAFLEAVPELLEL